MTQDVALSILKTGANVFLTGQPGSGKTYTVNKYIEYLLRHRIEPAITASTGIAATHIGGVTIHSWSGIGIKKSLSLQDLALLKKKSRLASRVKKTQVLIIDEISMLDASVLTTVDHALRELRASRAPFGGIQVVFVGDFFQLPPVSRQGEDPVQFAFDSSAWVEADPVICYLEEQYRQEDEALLSILRAIRNGEVTSDTFETLSSRIEESHSHKYTRLYSHNINVDKLNDERISGISGDEVKYYMRYSGTPQLVEQLKRGCLSPEVLILKIGAQVMFTKNNFDLGYVNGTLGEVIGFSEDENPIVKIRSGRRIEVTPEEWTIADGERVLATIAQNPLRLAWAITVHKSQGMTLDGAIIDLSNAFEYGQGYVALSRVRTLDNLFLLGLNARALEVHPGILEKDLHFQKSSRIVFESSQGKAQDISLYEDFIIRSGGQIEVVKVGQVREKKIDTYAASLELLQSGLDVKSIAEKRGMTVGTIIKHLEKLFSNKKIDSQALQSLVPIDDKKLPKIYQAFDMLGSEHLKPIFENFGGKYSYDEIRLARLLYVASKE